MRRHYGIRGQGVMYWFEVCFVQFMATDKWLINDSEQWTENINIIIQNNNANRNKKNGS